VTKTTYKSLSKPACQSFFSSNYHVGLSPAPSAKGSAALCMKGGFGAAAGFGQKQFRYTGKVRPGKLSPFRPVPSSIPHPDYAKDGKPKNVPNRMPWEIEVKTPEEVQGMREACRVAREVLDAAGKIVRPGITTDEIDKIVHEETIKRGAYPSPLNYYGFPKSVCTSINEVVCHGIPDSTVLQDGDIVNVDVTCYYKGFHGDLSEMFLVGNVDQKGKELVKVAYECLDKAIEALKPGMPYSEIGSVIQVHADKANFSVTQNFCGHGIGRIFHTTPNVLHHKNDEPNGTITVGHIFTIEPMVNEGSRYNVTWPDKWTATTADGKRSAQFEHTIYMGPNGPERLTARIPGSSQKFWWE